jgi:hypothetical protein
MSKIPLHTRRCQLHWPMTCVVCKDEIKIGERYYGFKGREVHVDCSNVKKEEAKQS